MKTRGYLYVEIWINGFWSLAETLVKNPVFRHRKYHKEYEPEFIPQSRYLPGADNVAESIINASGKRGLPIDISPELLEYFNYRWKKEDVFGKGWMTLEEIEEYIEDNENFYLAPDWFAQYGEPDKVRVVFWYVHFAEEQSA